MQPFSTPLLSQSTAIPGLARLKTAWALQVSTLGDHVLLHAMQPLPDNFSGLAKSRTWLEPESAMLQSTADVSPVPRRPLSTVAHGEPSLWGVARVVTG